MDRVEFGTRLEVVGIRTRTRIRLLLQVIGIVMVCVAGFNLILAPIVEMNAIAGSLYRPLVAPVVESGSHYIADILLLVVGMVVTWIL